MTQDFSRFEVSSPEAAIAHVKKYGVAIWRGLVPTPIVEGVIEPTNQHCHNNDIYVSARYGVLSSNILPVSVMSQIGRPEMIQVFGGLIGKKHRPPVAEIYLRTPGYFSPHPWHQDANEGNQAYAALSWTAVTTCGDKQAGLSFAIGNPGHFIGGYEAAARFAQENEVISPVLYPGDTFFFDVFSIHSTNETPEMRESRIAYKLGAHLA